MNSPTKSCQWQWCSEEPQDTQLPGRAVGLPATERHSAIVGGSGGRRYSCTAQVTEWAASRGKQPFCSIFWASDVKQAAPHFERRLHIIEQGNVRAGQRGVPRPGYSSVQTYTGEALSSAPGSAERTTCGKQVKNILRTNSLGGQTEAILIWLRCSAHGHMSMPTKHHTTIT